MSTQGIAIGVGGLEAESVMLGRASYAMPEIVGVELTGSLSSKITATDLVLALTGFSGRRLSLLI